MRALTKQERVELARWNQRREKPARSDRHVYRWTTGPCTVWQDPAAHRRDALRRRGSR